MEEKERYEFIDFEDRIELIDTENKKALDDADKIKDTLNQQDKRIKELEQENQQLKQQLAEKDKEIESLKDNWNVLCDYLGDCVVKYDEEDVNGIYGEVLDKVNILKRYDYKRYQDKISFAIEQLNLLYKTLTTEDVWRAMKKGWWLNNDECLQLRQTIDNQIASLKKGVE